MPQATMTEAATVFIVDDDPSVSSALARTAQQLQLQAECYATAQEFLEAYDPSRIGCLILDVMLPGMSGIELQKKLALDQVELPIIMISGHADVPMAVDAMRGGAITFLQKPFRLAELTDRIQEAIACDLKLRQSRLARERLAGLTVKEREVMQLIATGKTNKEMAEQLGLSLRAIEDRRRRVYRKLDVSSLSQLMQIYRQAEGLDEPAAPVRE